MRLFSFRMVRGLVPALTAIVLVVANVSASTAQEFDTTAPVAFMKDFQTGEILFEKDADREIPPASLVKLMTVAVIFHEIEEGRASLDDTFFVSENAWRTGGAASGGSTMFLPLNSEVRLEDLIKGILIQSGNDATIVAAEGLAGSVPAFAALMNQRAAEIGVEDSQFNNPHGLPDPDQHVTARDLVTIAEHIIRTYPQYYPWFSQREFTFNDITQRNRNPLLALGADGMKTGHTSEAGYGLVASGTAGDRRVILAMSGMQTPSERAEEAQRLMNWGLRSFQTLVVLPAGETAGEAPVIGGVEPSVPLASQQDLSVLAARGTEGQFTVVVSDVADVQAPVAEGQEIGQALVQRNGETVSQVPLYATGAVEQSPFMQRSIAMARAYGASAGAYLWARAQDGGRAAWVYISSYF